MELSRTALIARGCVAWRSSSWSCGRPYRAFNARDIAAAPRLMHSELDWPNAWEGGRVVGRAAVRDYWERQFAAISSNVEPERFTAEPDGSAALMNGAPREAFGGVGSRSVVRVAAEQAERMSMDLAASAAERKARTQQTLVDRIFPHPCPAQGVFPAIERFHQNCTLRTAALILPIITSPSSWPWSVLKPFMAATTPAITRATSRISATYSTVPWPRSPPSGLALKSAAWMRPNRRCMWVPPALRTAVGRHAAERRRTAPDASVKRD